MASLLSMLARQDQQQREVYGHRFEPCHEDGSTDGPAGMTDAGRMEYVRWNTLALISELFEGLAETGWRPWADSDHMHVDRYLGELVDAQLFLMNLMLATGLPPQTLAEKFSRMLLDKTEVNRARQQEGYDGVAGKCPACQRALDDKDVTYEMLDDATGNYQTLCVCGHVLSESLLPA